MSPLGRRIAIWGTVTALVVAGLVYAFWPQPVPVDMAQVERGPMRVTIDEEGETRIRDVYVLSAPLSGRLMRIENDVGDTVVAGETVLATIQPRDPSLLDVRSLSEAQAAVKAAEAARALAEAELDREKAALAFAINDVARARRLHERGNISERSLDAAELEVRIQRAAVKSAEAALKVKSFKLENARAALITPLSDTTLADGKEGCCVDVYAPVSGEILRIIRESESVVLAADPILEIGDPHDLEVVVDLLSTDAVQVEAGNPVLIEDWGGQTLTGRVRRVEPYGFTKISALGIEEQRVNVIIDLTEPPERWQRLGHGFRVEASIVIWEAPEVVQLPVGALFRGEEGWAVFVVEAGRAMRRIIEVGHMNSQVAEVLRGLSEGDTVVLHPSDRITDGIRVAAREAGGL